MSMSGTASCGRWRACWPTVRSGRAHAYGSAQRRVDHGADAKGREYPEPAHDESAPELLPDDGEMRGPAAARLVVEHVPKQVDRRHDRLD